MTNWFGTYFYISRYASILHYIQWPFQTNDGPRRKLETSVFSIQVSTNAALFHTHRLRSQTCAHRHTQTQMCGTSTKGRACYTDETTVIKKETHQRQRGRFNYLEWDSAFYWCSCSLISSAWPCWCWIVLLFVLCTFGRYSVFGSWAFCYIRPCGHNIAVGKPVITLQTREAGSRWQQWLFIHISGFCFTCKLTARAWLLLP